MGMFISGSTTSTSSIAYGTFGGYPSAGPWAPLHIRAVGTGSGDGAGILLQQTTDTNYAFVGLLYGPHSTSPYTKAGIGFKRSKDDFGAKSSIYFSISDSGAAANDLNWESDAKMVISGSAGYVGIGTNAPGGTTATHKAKLHVEDADTHTYINVVSDTDAIAGIRFGDTGDNDWGHIRYNNDTEVFQILRAEKGISIINPGYVGIGTNNPGARLHVSASEMGHGLYVSGSAGSPQVGIGTTNPTGLLNSSSDPTPMLHIYGQRPGIQFEDRDDNLDFSIYANAGLTFQDSTNNAIRMLIASSGAITMATQPAFLVKPSSAQTDLAIDTSVTVIFATEIFDQGGDFASNTFTAPVTGKYQFNASIVLYATVDSAASYYQLELIASNRTIYSLIDPDFGQDAIYWTLNLSALVDMDASDTAYCAIRQADGSQQVDIHAVSSFSGYLAC